MTTAGLPPASSPPPPTEDSYIDYETFLSPAFSPHSFANALILHTNPPDDPTLDLSTPLSRVLFDLQEIDSHIHTLTTTNAVPLLSYAKESREASQKLVEGVEGQLRLVEGAYRRLEKEVVARSRGAEDVVRVLERLSGVTRVLRGVGRLCVLARQLEVQVGEFFGGKGGGEDWKLLLRAGYAVSELRRMLGADDGKELERLQSVQTVITYLLVPAEQFLRTKAGGEVGNWTLPAATSTTPTLSPSNSSVSASTLSSLSSSSSSSASSTSLSTQHRQILTASLTRLSAAIQILYLLSPSAAPSPSNPGSLLLTTLQTHLTNQTTSSLSALSRVFSSLTPQQPSPPALDRSLAEIVSKLKSIVAIEEVLSSIDLSSLHPEGFPASSSSDPSDPNNSDSDSSTTKPPSSSSSPSSAPPGSLLSSLLTILDTPTLPTLFFLNLSSGLETLVRNVLARGGTSARGLRAGKDKLREGLKGVVERGLSSAAGEGDVDAILGIGRVGVGKGRGRKRKEGEREVGVGLVVGGVERGFGGGASGGK